jgi:hypothetical protein
MFWTFCSDLQGTPCSRMVLCSLLTVLVIPSIARPRFRACADVSGKVLEDMLSPSRSWLHVLI